MLRIAGLSLFSILGCTNLFAQNKLPQSPFDLPGEIVSKPSNLRPEVIPVVDLSSAAPGPRYAPVVVQTPQACANGACGTARKPSGWLAGHHDSAGDCLDRLSNWLFYRNPPWPQQCRLIPTPFHTPGYAYFYHPSAAETRTCNNPMNMGCSTCGVQAQVAQRDAQIMASAVTPVRAASKTQIQVIAMPKQEPAVRVVAKPETTVRIVAKPVPRPLVPNTSATMAQSGELKSRNEVQKATSYGEDGEPYYYPSIVPPPVKQTSAVSPYGAVPPNPGR